MPGSGPLRPKLLVSVAALALMAQAPAGDPARGLAVVTRQSSTCVLCHGGPWPNPHLHGTIGPNLEGVGARLSADEIRDRLMDASRTNPDTIMPAFYTTEGRSRVGAAWADRTILTAPEIADAVAYLATLR